MAGNNTEKHCQVSISIYRVTNTVNGKVYVGQTRVPRRRWTDHKYAARMGVDTYFYHAIRKYGSGVFVFQVIEVCSLGRADNREIYWIKKLRSNNPIFGYNSSIGGTNGNNSTSPEARKKISLAKKGVSTGPCSPEKAEKIRQAKLASGYRHSEETKRKISNNRKVSKLTEEWKVNIRNGLLASAKYALTIDQIEEILKCIGAGHSLLSIAKKFGVSWRTVQRVKLGTYMEKQKDFEGRVSR